MSVLRGLVSYKKKDGVLSLLDGGQTLEWEPASAGAAQPVSIPISRITNLQATPPTSAKVMIKVFVSGDGESTVDQYVFTFTSPTDARPEADAMKDGLTGAIQAYKTALAAQEEADAAAAAAKSASTENGKTNGQAADKGGVEFWTKAELESNMELQQSLLASSPELMKIFHETVVLGQVTATQFWSSRTHLLRAYAAERAQVKGPYNVLATIKLKIEDNVSKLNLSRDQIHQIFDQHPLIKRAYDENVPKLSEDQFWGKLIVSRLFKKLKGERLVPNDPHDDVLDQYLRMEDDANEKHNDTEEFSVPNVINLKGNEENHSQKRGNQPDLTMRPNRSENVPIIRTLNSLSSKIMGHVIPPYKQGQDDEDTDRRYMDELRLVDLRAESAEERIILNIQDQQRFFDSNSERKAADGTIDGVQKPVVAIGDGVKFMHDALGTGSIDLAQALRDAGVRDNPNSNMETDADGSRDSTGSDALAAATKQIMSCVHIRRGQMPAVKSRSKDTSREGLSEDTFLKAKLTHSTTNEFLRQFWNAFLSGESKRASEVSGMVTSLKRALERIDAVATAAEEEKTALIQKLVAEQEQREREGKKKKKRKIDSDVGGGKTVVMQITAVELKAIELALKRYEQAVAEVSEK